jgi:hypothetical protein
MCNDCKAGKHCNSCFNPRCECTCGRWTDKKHEEKTIGGFDEKN